MFARSLRGQIRSSPFAEKKISVLDRRPGTAANAVLHSRL
jgi:hypothetical protein